MYSIPLVTTKGNGKQMTTKTQQFVDRNNKVIARGRLTELTTDLLLNNGTRFYSTQSDNYNINIVNKAVKK
jgi:hypothetical protein